MNISIKNGLHKALDAFEVIQVERQDVPAGESGNGRLRFGDIAGAYRHLGTYCDKGAGRRQPQT
ncbi:hypothetical protein AA15237_0981 [Komagataeibacter xylinus NBRC 15237]|nr:hypothetical protein AA15237_0981 [Komagataeibacter xylinus NBRC 15237]